MNPKQFILEIIQSAEPAWCKVTEDSFTLTRLTSNSSQVFLVQTTQTLKPNSFIFRFFGSADTLDISTSSSILLKLSKNGLAPKIFVETPNYRLEEFLQGFRSLSNTEISQPKLLKQISSKLKLFHSLDFSDILNPQSLVCVKNAKKWRKIAQRTLTPNPDSRTEEFLQATGFLSNEYWNIFEEILPKGSPVVLSHMDTSYLNILYQEEKDEVYLLDFDYTGYCYRGFDLAMLLTDIQYDYSFCEFPYFKYEPKVGGGDEVLAECVKGYGEGVEMFLECKRCMIAVHYLWAMWAFSLVGAGQDGLDMVSYGILRFQEFLSGYEEYKNLSFEERRSEALVYFS